MNMYQMLRELDRMKRLAAGNVRDAAQNPGAFAEMANDRMAQSLGRKGYGDTGRPMGSGAMATTSGGNLGFAPDDASPMSDPGNWLPGGGMFAGHTKRVFKGLPSLLSLREATKEADAAISAAKSGGPAIISRKPEPLRLLPKTDSPYIETEQFLPARAEPRMSGGVPKYNERTEALQASRAAKHAIDRNVGRGQHLGMTEWYGTNPLWEAAKQEGLSFDEFNRLMMHQASASQRSPVPGQIKRGSATWVAEQQGRLDPDLPRFEFDKGYGSLAQKDIIKRAYEIAAGEGLDTTKKLGRFHQNLMGNLEPVTVDVMAMRGPTMATKDPRWLATDVRSETPGGMVIEKPRELLESGQMSVRQALQRPGFWEAAPKGAEYGAIEDMYRLAADRAGIRPAEAQATAWYGSGAEAGLRSHPMTYMQAVEERIFDTAGKRNETPSQVLADFLRGRKPLMSFGGGGAGLGMLDSGYREEEYQ